MRVFRVLAVIGALLASPWAAPAPEARPLTIGFKGEAFSIDPHFQNGPIAHTTNRHVFDRLIDFAPDGSLKPALALSWERQGDEAWIFRLRPNVTFHDGAPFTAEDVAATIRRIPTANNNTGPFNVYIRQIDRVEVRDPLTVVFHTKGPTPTLPSLLAIVSIISAKHEKASTADFNSGAAAIGTGPFRFVSYTRTQAYELARNDSYWGGAPDWTKLTIRFIPNDATRIAALIAGEIDVATNILAQDREAITRNANLNLLTGPSFRVVFLNFDLANAITPHATGADNQPLPQNPLRDIRVRRAIAAAIDNQLLADRIMLGAAVPVGQLASAETFGHLPGLTVRPTPLPDPRALLREAGYPNGFNLVVHAAPEAAQNAPGLAQGIAAMLGRAGITTTVQTQPWQVYIGEIMKQGGPAYAAFMMSWGNSSGDSMDVLQALLHTTDRARNLGAQNQSRYSNPAADALIGQAASTFDDAERKRLQQEAMRLIMADVPLVPLHVQVGMIGARKGIAYPMNPREHIHAHEMRIAP
jgi:peptide/nickel transport system substrate-binding protein